MTNRSYVTYCLLIAACAVKPIATKKSVCSHMFCVFMCHWFRFRDPAPSRPFEGQQGAIGFLRCPSVASHSGHSSMLHFEGASSGELNPKSSLELGATWPLMEP